jgi:hypothetical protein
MDKEKIRTFKEQYEQEPKIYEHNYFYIAICEVALGNFPDAKRLFEQAALRMFEKNPMWIVSGQPDWLVDITILSGLSDLYPSVAKELYLYRAGSTKIRPVANAPLTLYCCCIMEMLIPQSGNMNDWIGELLKRPKYKDLYPAGLIIQAIQDHDQSAFDSSLRSLLKVHEGKVKYGEFRWSPLGWLCLPAMVLSYLASRENLTINVESDYFSYGYLKYIMHP